MPSIKIMKRIKKEERKGTNFQHCCLDPFEVHNFFYDFLKSVIQWAFHSQIPSKMSFEVVKILCFAIENDSNLIKMNSI